MCAMNSVLLATNVVGCFICQVVFICSSIAFFSWQIRARAVCSVANYPNIPYKYVIKVKYYNVLFVCVLLK